jgi:multiple sugar transport system permease protein
MVSKLGMLDTKITLIIVYTGINIPFAIWMLKGFIDEIPETLEDAAMVDGCSKFTALIKVTLPLITPGIAAVGIFTFLLCWNDFQIAFFLSAKYAKTLPLHALTFITESGIYWGPMSAFGSLVIFPAILYAYYCQKYITRGLTMGAIKG